MRYAEVAVDAPVPSTGTFSYRIPDGLTVVPGHSVWVPFGPRHLQGIVMELVDIPAVEQVRDIVSLVEEPPLLTEAQLQLVRWTSRRYMAPLFQSALLFLPPASRRRDVAFVNLTLAAADLDPNSLPPTQKEAFEYLRGQKDTVAVTSLRRALGARGARGLAGLERGGLVARESKTEGRRVGPRTTRLLEATVSGTELDEALKALLRAGALRQADLLQVLVDAGHPLPQAEALRRAGTAAAVVAPMQKKGLIDVTRQRVRRDPLADVTYSPSPPLAPTLDQRRALDDVIAAIHREDGETKPYLLHGATGSGKTEVYLQALQAAVEQGKRGIVLVPEIALTPQTIQRFWERFPNRVAILHSQLSPGERYDEWWGIHDGNFDVVVGPRSALGAPQPDLGIIIIDEEHDAAYKQQDPAPRYHTRDLAEEMARLTGAILVLGSATPDIASYYQTQVGNYQLLELPDRIADDGGAGGVRLQPHPDVQIVDMREELKAGNRSMFSRALASALKDTLVAREQAILFLNRRGSASSVQCRDCGHLVRCPRCSMPFTFHAPSSLRCHQCNRRASTPSTCPECGSSRIRFVGAGTQTVVEEVQKLLPRARVLRWDRDTTRGKGAHEAILGSFLNYEADILVGTQMLAKGLHIPLVSLVGAVNGDVGLHLPDFRAPERTFQLLSQVAGRAGRGRSPGRAFVQTYNPQDYAIQAVGRQSYEAFFDEEIAFRRALHYPPFTQLIRLVHSNPSESGAQRQAVRVFEQLRQEIAIKGLPDIELIGPAPAYVQRLRGRYRWNLLIQGRDPVSLLEPIPLGEGWTVDVDPMGML